MQAGKIQLYLRLIFLEKRRNNLENKKQELERQPGGFPASPRMTTPNIKIFYPWETIMKKPSSQFLKLGLTIALTSLISACSQHEKPAPLASETLFNSDWQFVKSDNTADFASGTALTGWEKVQLPHTTEVESLVVTNQWQGDAWYKKTITADPSWQNKPVFLRFDAAMNAAAVFLNGKKIASHLGGGICPSP